MDSAGRRSAEWRAWTGKERERATDEVYAAPRRRIDEFKISLHSNGYAQYGFSERVRQSIRPGDRHALDRWQLSDVEVVPGWKPLLALQFADSQLLDEDTNITAKTVVVPSAPAGQTTSVLLLVGEPGSPPLDNGPSLVGILDRASGGSVALVSTHTAYDAIDQSGTVPALASGISWKVPGLSQDDPHDWVLQAGSDGTRRVIELVRASHVQLQLPALLPYRGAVRMWSDAPVELQQLELACGILVCRQDGATELFVDQRSRCDHSRLGANAADLCDSHARGEADSGWGRLPNGTSYTILSTQRVPDEDANNP